MLLDSLQNRDYSSTSNLEPTGYRSRDPNRSCTHCGRKGHEVSQCFLLHGYPEWCQEQHQRPNNNTSPTQVLAEEEEVDQVEEVMAAVVPHKQRLPLAIIR